MGKRGGLRAELGGEAIYAWLVGEHLRDIKEASRNANDGGRAYHAAVNEFLAMVAGDIGYYDGSWELWQKKTLRDDLGQPLRPDSRLSKTHRRIEVAHAVNLLRVKGVLGYKRTDFSDDQGALKSILAARQAPPVANGVDAVKSLLLERQALAFVDEDDAGDEDEDDDEEN
ncbi:MAG: hypothetical protein WC876_04560 [Candidatus Thermoplasmatota archaeon]|jgi:hypothetical protein